MIGRTAAFAWVKVLVLAGAAIVAAAGLLASGAVAVWLMLSGDPFTAAVMVFVMGCVSLAVVVLLREMRDAIVKTGRRAPSWGAVRTVIPRLRPRATLQQSYFREPPVT